MWERAYLFRISSTICPRVTAWKTFSPPSLPCRASKRSRPWWRRRKRWRTLRALLDEQVPADLATHIARCGAHEIVTVAELGWKGLKNGQLLLQMRDAGIQALITVDRRMEHQPNIPRAEVGLIVLHAHRARIQELAPLVSEVSASLDAIRPGEIIHLYAPPPA